MKCLNNYKGGFPCGRCRACRINLQREKATRLEHERQSHDKGCFVTLTYSPDTVPTLPNGLLTLNRKDPQLFMKLIRRRIEPQKIKSFGCGEYGEHTFRPHYHVILFDVDMYDKRIFCNHNYSPKDKCWHVDCDSWKLGHVSVAPLNDKRCAYVAKYCVKKYTGEKAKDWYLGRLPEFCWTSRGIGLDYCMKHAERLIAENCITVKGSKMPLPRYYINKIMDAEEKFKRKLRMRAEEDKAVFDEAKKFNFDNYKLIQYKKDANECRTRSMAMRELLKGVRDNEI